MRDFLAEFQRLGVTRVFIYGLGSLHLESCAVYTRREECERAVEFFRSNGIEVGFWVDSFGHGRPLFSCYDDRESGDEFVPMLSIDGESSPYALCPDGERFSLAYMKGMRALASLNPDYIMLDDDFRFARFGIQYLTCFCDYHMREYLRRIGENVPKEKISDLIFTGGKNKYRDAYFDMLSDSLLGFARKIRAAVNEVNPGIRIGAASVRESLDFSGTDQSEIARALAGDTPPFVRLSGAPYGGTDVIECVEFVRLQLATLEGEKIECMTEGDTYPRPRYNMPSKVLELYNLALAAEPLCNERLDYLFDYTQPPTYEPGYAERAHRLEPSLRAIRAAFENKKRVGVYVYNKRHKIRDTKFRTTLDRQVVKRLHMTSENPGSIYLSKNSIPSCFEDTGYPVLIFGENARDVDLSLLSRGAILDTVAAEILKERGVDTGIVDATPMTPTAERFDCWDYPVTDVNSGAEFALTVKEGAEILSRFMPLDTPASYSYTNDKGERFLVLATDTYLKRSASNFAISYHRATQLVRWIEQGGTKLPAICPGNPNLYIACSSGNGELSVLLVNSFADDVFSPTVLLDKKYSAVVSTVGCEVELDGDKVTLGDISPFGFACFTVK